MIFIDPYEENIIDSELAEFSQLLQSCNAKYEMYNTRDPFIQGNNVRLALPPSKGMEFFNAELINYLKQNFSHEDYIIIRLLEVSQFIRMLPFKMEINLNSMYFFYCLASYLYANLKWDYKL